jgi:hypothetical protein
MKSKADKLKEQFTKDTGEEYIEYTNEGMGSYIDEYVEWLENRAIVNDAKLKKEKALHKHSVSHCVCSENNKHGETSIICCNECGKPTEKFWYCEKDEVTDIVTQQRKQFIDFINWVEQSYAPFWIAEVDINKYLGSINCG